MPVLKVFSYSRAIASQPISPIHTLRSLTSCDPLQPATWQQRSPPNWPRLSVNCSTCSQMSCPYRPTWLHCPHLIPNSRNAASLLRWRNSLQVMEEQMAGVPEDEKRQMLAGNAVKFFRLDG